MDYDPGLFLKNLQNHSTYEFHLHVQGLQRTYKNHVNSIVTFAGCFL